MKRPRSEAAQLLGARLRDHRRRLGLSQQDLAALCGLDVANYGRLERGVSNPTLETLLHVAATIEIDPGQLLAGLRAPEDNGRYTVGEFLRARARARGRGARPTG